MPTKKKPVRRCAPRRETRKGMIPKIALGTVISISIGILSSLCTGARMANQFAVDQATRRERVDAQLSEHNDRITMIEHTYVPRSEHEAKDKMLTEELTQLNQRTTETRDDVKDLRTAVNQLLMQHGK